MRVKITEPQEANDFIQFLPGTQLKVFNSFEEAEAFIKSYIRELSKGSEFDIKYFPVIANESKNVFLAHVKWTDKDMVQTKSLTIEVTK